MISSQKINRILSKIRLPNFQNNKKATVVIPLDFNSGYTIQTEKGQYSPIENVDVDNFSFFEQVFDGKEDIVHMWSGSQQGRDGIEKVDNFIQGTNDTQDMITHKKVKVQVGDVRFGMRTDGSEELNIGNEASFSDFSATKFGASISIRFEAQSFGKQDLFKLWAFPELYGETLFYISNVERTFIMNRNDPNSQLALEITFDTLMDKLQKSGRSVQQFVHSSAIGWGYAWPKITRNQQGEITSIELDEEKIKPQGVKLLNIERFSPAITCGFKAIGYKIGKAEMEGKEIGVGKIYPPKKLEDGSYEYRLYEPQELYPSHYVSARSSMYARTSTPTQNYYWISRFWPTLEKHSEWKDNVKSLADDFTLYQYQGELKLGCTIEEVINTNNAKNQPKSAYYDNSHKYILTTDAPTNEDTKVSTPTIVKNIASTRCDKNITLGWNWTKSTINFYNSNIYQSIDRLPISQLTTIFVGIDSLPFVGNFLNKALGGIPFTAPSTTRDMNDKPINGFIDTELFKYYVSLIQSTTQDKWIPLDPFGNGKENTNKDPFDLNSINTSEAFYLNHKIKYNGREHDTYELGQFQKWNYVSEDHISLSNINVDGSKFIIKSEQVGTTQTTNNFEVLDNWEDLNNDGYVVVGYQMKDFFRGEYRITAFQNYNTSDGLSSPIWNSQFYSNANWRKSIRDWTTNGVCNYFANIPMEGQNVELPQQEEFLNNNTDTFSWPQLGRVGQVLESKQPFIDYGFVKSIVPIGQLATTEWNTNITSLQSFASPKNIDDQLRYTDIATFKQVYAGKKIRLHYQKGYIKKHNVYNNPTNGAVHYSSFNGKIFHEIISDEGNYTEINVNDIASDGTITITTNKEFLFYNKFFPLGFKGIDLSGKEVSWNYRGENNAIFSFNLIGVILKLSIVGEQTSFKFSFDWRTVISATDNRPGINTYWIEQMHSTDVFYDIIDYSFEFDKIDIY